MLAFLFVVIAVIVRFLPHTFHFTPVGAALLFFGAKQDRKWMWVPIWAFATTDILLNKLVYHYPVTWETFVSTGWYVAALFIGSLLKKDGDKFKVGHVVGASLAGSLSFFLISNFAVWVAYAMYPKTLAGLGACYVAAIPFAGSTLGSDLIYSVAFFATPVLIAAVKRHRDGLASDDVAAA